MNNYIRTLKNILDRYADEVRGFVSKRKEARATYLPEVADKEVKRLDDDIAQASVSAEEKIRAARDQAIDAARAWGVLRGSDINNGDLALLQGGFELSASDISEMVERYRQNATMLRAIATYYEKRQGGQTRDEIILDGLQVPEIPTVDNKIQSIENFARSAAMIVRTVRADPEALTSFKDKEKMSDASSMDLLVSGFGLPEMSSRKDLYVLGD